MNNLPNDTFRLPIDKLLNKLEKVTVKKSTKDGLNQWQVLCPAHADKTPSLIITECPDNRLLLKCWTGCTASEIVSAIGLELKDLFKYEAKSIYTTGNYHNTYKKLPSKKAIVHEQLIIQIAEIQINQGQVLAEPDKARYLLALKRLQELKYVRL